MELALNIFWLLLALGSYALWFPRDSRPGRKWRRRGESSLALVAFGCALVILFPVISLTDDLHAETAIVEDSKPSRMALKNARADLASSHSTKLTAPPATSLLAGLFSVSCALAGRVVLTEATSPSAAFSRYFEGRAPPFSHN